jgi:pyruvate/2-oxoglutarate dehydrogenase complex dihydrolipoamide dehydrogenase (E3) component
MPSASTRGRHGAGVAIQASCEEEPREIAGSHLLLAVGRNPNTNDLGLDKAGVATNERGFIEVDDELRTSVAGIWALGDVNGRGAFTHTSYNDYEIVAANLLDGDRARCRTACPSTRCSPIRRSRVRASPSAKCARRAGPRSSAR